MMINWTEIIIGLMGFISAILTAFIIPLIKSKTTEKQRAIVSAMVKDAVKAAEQTLKPEDPTGGLRKQYVLDYLLGKGIKLNIEDLDVMIEAAVKELNIMEAEFVR